VDLWQVSQTVAPLCVAVLGLAVRAYAVVAWQLAQPVATDTLAWNLDGNHEGYLWQVPQFAVVGIWLLFLPVALLLLWQLEQLVALVKVLWSALAPVQIVVDLWQLSQLAVVERWLAVLPVAVVPL